MANEEPDPRHRLSRWLAHPASLLLLTAVLTGLLAPWITNRWEARDKQVEAQRAASERQVEAQRAANERQREEKRADGQREREVKSAILNHIGTASAAFLSAIEVGVIDGPRPEARAEYRALQKAALEIGSQLAAYFPRSLPVVRWSDYTYSLRNAYMLLTAPAGRARNLWLDRLNRYLDVLPTQLHRLCLPSTHPEFAGDLRKLVLAFQNKEEAVVRDVAASQTVLTGTPTRDRNVKRKHYDPTQRRPCGA